MKAPALTALIAGLLGSLAGPLGAQGFLYEWPQEYCWTVAAAGDIDADGVDDFAVCEAGDVPEEGVVHVYSGRTGGEILSLPVGGFSPGVVAMGDVDLDGHADLAVRAFDVSTWSSYLCLISGASGARLWQYVPAGPPSPGYSMATIGDLDHDGVPELVVGAPESFTSTLSGQVFVLSGATGDLRARVGSLPGATWAFGAMVCAAGDLDLDGVPDFLVGDYTYSDWGGRVSAHSGLDASLIYSIDGPIDEGRFGMALASIGDADGDGVPDFVVGAPAEPVPTEVRFGRVRLFSGVDGAMLSTIEGEAFDGEFGYHVVAFQDLDGDAVRDVLIASGQRCGGHLCTGGDLRVYSSATGAILYVGPLQDSRAAVVPDVNGDGVDDYLLPRAALALTNLPGPALEACPASLTSDGCQALIDHGGAPSLTLGPDLSFHASRVPENTFGLFAWSHSLDEVPLGNSWLCLGAPVHRLPVVTATAGEAGCLVNTGTLSTTLTKLELATLGPAIGQRFYVQCWFRDPGFTPPNDFGLSQTLSLVLWP